MNVLAGHVDETGRIATGASSATSTRALGLHVLIAGFLADRADLRGRLGIASAGPLDDAELIAHAFRRWGRDLQRHVNGQFAAIVGDPQNGEALLTHDALGLAPLFYARRRGGLAFATHLVELLDGDEGALDEQYLAEYLALGVATTKRTPYAGISRLLPGESLWWSRGGVQTRTTWSLADVAPVRAHDDADYEERFRALLGDAVRAAREDAGRVWSDLSGGLDSSTIVCVAAAAGPRDMAALSLVTPGYPESDERRWMRAVIERYALPWHQLDIESMLPFARLPGEFTGEPTPAVIEAEQTRVQRQLLASAGVSTLLCGSGGDAVMGAAGGPIETHLADRLFDGRPLAALSDVAAWRAGERSARSPMFWALRCFAEPAFAHVRGRSARGAVRLPLQGWIDAAYIRRHRLDRNVPRIRAPRCRHPGRQALADSLWTDAIALGAIAQQRAGFDVRYPLLYRPLVEFMSAIPWEQKMRPRCDRYLQRRALAGVLPELVRRRASKGGGSRTLTEGLRRSRGWFEYLTDTPLMAERGIADAARWRHAVRAAMLGETHGDQFFLAGVAVEAFLRQLEGFRTEWRLRRAG